MKSTLRRLACMAMVASLGLSVIMAQDAQATSENNKKLELSVYLGGSTPLGSFGKSPIIVFDVSSEDMLRKIAYNGGITYGNADWVGVNVGMKAKYNIPEVKGLGIMATADMFFNTTFGFKIKEDNSTYGVIDEELYSVCINIPIMFGANYDYAINDKISIWGEAAVGANLRIITTSGTTKRVEDVDNMELSFKQNYDNCFTLGFQTGVGVKLNKKYSIGLHYYNLGNKAVTGVMTDIVPGIATTDVKNTPFSLPELKTSMLLIRLGYHF